MTEITELSGGSALSFEAKEGGYLVNVGKWKEEKAPIGRVFCLKNTNGTTSGQKQNALSGCGASSKGASRGFA